MPKMRGFTLVEMLAVITVIAILSAIALPNFQDMRLRQALHNGEQDVLQSLQKARQMARSQGVFVNVQFDDNEMRLSPSNRPQQVERIPLPDNLVFANATAFMFTPNGALGLPDGDNNIELGGLTFDISPAHQQAGVAPRSIQVGSLGSIAGL